MLCTSSAVCLGCESETDRIEARLSELKSELPLRDGETLEARKRRIRARLEPALTPDFRIDAPWLEVNTDRDFALASAAHLEELFPLVALDLDDVEVSLSESGKRAWIHGKARASSAQASDIHAFTLAFELDLAKQGSQWQLVRLSLSDPSQPLPEARP
jgi:hypothetical protein